MENLARKVEEKTGVSVHSYVEKGVPLLMFFPDEHSRENADLLDASVESVHNEVIRIYTLGVEAYSYGLMVPDLFTHIEGVRGFGKPFV